jgi:hypothetical protein
MLLKPPQKTLYIYDGEIRVFSDDHNDSQPVTTYAARRHLLKWQEDNKVPNGTFINVVRHETLCKLNDEHGLNMAS